MTEQPAMASAADCAVAIIQKFDGQSGLSRELTRAGHPVAQNTISNWAKTSIPEKYRPILIQIARREGIDHTPTDYVRYLEAISA